jgi:DHA2 family multidrug resistance protein-like MFS transporter
MWAIMVAVCMATLDTAIANVALPTIAADLHASPAASVWIVNGYQLAMIGAILPFASLGEIVGLRRVYIYGLGAFILSSLVCGLSVSLPMLAVARVVQGIAAAAVMGVNTALLRHVFPLHMLGRAVGNNAMVVALSFVAGPSVAAAILSFASWNWLFLVNVPFGLLAVALAWNSLPETSRTGHRFDRVAALLCAGVLSVLVLAIGDAAHAAPWERMMVEIGLVLVCGALLVRRQAGHPAPILAFDLLRRPQFALSIATAVCSFAAQGLAFVSLPFLFQNVMGRSEVETGFLITPWSLVVAVMAPIAGRLSDRYSAGILGGIGMAILCVGMWLMASMPAQPDNLAIAWRMCICGAGFGFFQAPNLKAIMLAAPPERSGSASGMVGVGRLLGQSSGAALVAACFGIAAMQGPILALWVGGAFAAVACLASFSRLLAPKPHPAQ